MLEIKVLIEKRQKSRETIKMQQEGVTNRLKIGQAVSTSTFHTSSLPLCFSATNVLCAEPPKKKNKNTNQLTAAKQDKRKRKLEKELRRMARNNRYLKPVEELEILPQLKREIQSGLRTREKTVFLSEELESQVLLTKEWTRYKIYQHTNEMRVLHRVEAAQERALAKLREESEELYQLAIKKDDNLLSLTIKGPLQNPPLDSHDPPDGKYIDNTNYFEKEVV